MSCRKQQIRPIFALNLLHLFIIKINLIILVWIQLPFVDVRSEGLVYTRCNTLDCACSVHRYVWDKANCFYHTVGFLFTGRVFLD